MVLFDTLNGSLMNLVYGWAFSQPLRKLWFNLTVTGLSVTVALLIGTVELAGVMADRLGLGGGVWSFASGLDLNRVGYAVVALFVVTWSVSILVWRVARLDERWASDPPGRR